MKMFIVGRFKHVPLLGYQAEVIAEDEFKVGSHLASKSFWREKAAEAWVEETVEYWVNQFEGGMADPGFTYQVRVEVTRP